MVPLNVPRGVTSHKIQPFSEKFGTCIVLSDVRTVTARWKSLAVSVAVSGTWQFPVCVRHHPNMVNDAELSAFSPAHPNSGYLEPLVPFPGRGWM